MSADTPRTPERGETSNAGIFRYADLPPSADTSRTDERWERDTPKVVVRMSRAMDALRTQLEQTEKDKVERQEELDDVANERDEARAEVERLRAALDKHHPFPLTRPCDICGTTQEDRSPLEDVSEAKDAYPGIFGTTQEDR